MIKRRLKEEKMRKIKFRIWNGESIEETIIDFNIDKETKYKEFYIYPDDVFMQFTGLKDKNGVPIYEGDIIKSIIFNEEDTGAIEWSNDGLYIVNGNHLQDYSFVDIEVIGNIYKHSELLRED